MSRFLETIQTMGMVQLAAMAAVMIGLLMFFTFITTRLAAPNMALLYGELDPSDAARIAGELQRAGIPFEMSVDGNRLLVPADRVAQLRMTLAGRGLPSGGASLLE